MRRKITGYIKNVTTREITKINTSAIQNKEKITFNFMDAINIIKLKDKEIELTRKNKDVQTKMIFIENTITLAKVTILETKSTHYLQIKTTISYVSNDTINIFYKIIEAKEEYELKLILGRNL